jgi:hypothetical protein
MQSYHMLARISSLMSSRPAGLMHQIRRKEAQMVGGASRLAECESTSFHLEEAANAPELNHTGTTAK